MGKLALRRSLATATGDPPKNSPSALNPKVPDHSSAAMIRGAAAANASNPLARAPKQRPAVASRDRAVGAP